MAKPKRIDWDKVIELLNQGLTPGAITTSHWNDIRVNQDDDKPVTRQAIVEIKNWAKRRHLLDNAVLTKPNPRIRIPEIKPQKKPEMELDEGVENLIRMAETVKEVVGLRKENWELKNRLALSEELRKSAEAKVKEYEQRQQRWQLAYQQGEIGGEK